MAMGVVLGVLLSATPSFLGWCGFKMGAREARRESNYDGFMGCSMVAWSLGWFSVVLAIIGAAILLLVKVTLTS